MSAKKKTTAKKTAPKAEPKKPSSFLYEVAKVTENGTLKIPGATVLKGARIQLTKDNAARLNELLPGCVVALGI